MHSVCFAVVRDHGGAIELEATLGQGSTFRVWLPAIPTPTEPEPEPEPSQESACPDDLANAKVLVMDDEPSVLEVLCAMLDSLGHRPLGTADGRAALAARDEAARSEEPFQVVILDLTVRGGDGRCRDGPAPA